MSTTAPRLELNSCPEKIQRLYVPRDEDGYLTTYFHTEIEPTTWHATSLARLHRTESGENAEYKVDSTCDILLYSYLRFVLPEVKVRREYADEYRIRWIHNVGTNRVEQCHLSYGGNTYPGFDSVWCDYYYQWFVSDDKKALYDICNGNVPQLQTFSTSLPSYVINIEQPWFYSLRGFPGWPIVNTKGDTIHNYTFRPLENLLQIQRLNTVTGEWAIIPFEENDNIVETIVEFPKGKKLSSPELWGKYGLFNPSDKENYLAKCGKLQKRSYILKEIISEIDENFQNSGTSHITTFTCEHPATAIFWSCRSDQSERFHDYSNYTTNPENVFQGFDPVSSASITYGQTSRFTKLPPDHLRWAVSRYHFPAFPRVMGYQACPFANDPSSGSSEIAYDLKKLNAKLTLDLATGSKGFLDIPEPDQSSMSYRVLVRILVLRIFTIEKQGEDFVFTLE